VRTRATHLFSFIERKPEQALVSLNKGKRNDELVTKEKLKILQKMNQQKLKELMKRSSVWMVTDSQSSTGHTEEAKSGRENAWLNFSGSEFLIDGDILMDSFLADQVCAEWSESNIKWLANLFLDVCIQADDNLKDKYRSSLWRAAEKIPQGDMGQLLHTFASWLRDIIFPKVSSENKAPHNSNLSLLWRPKSLLKSKKNITDAQNGGKEKQGACTKNAQQIAMISKPWNIWHAVGSFGSPEGKACWHIVRMVVRFLFYHNIECPIQGLD
jgi:hypothetical protein